MGSLHLESGNYSTKGGIAWLDLVLGVELVVPLLVAVLRVALGSVTTGKWMQMYLQLHMLGE